MNSHGTSYPSALQTPSFSPMIFRDHLQSNFISAPLPPAAKIWNPVSGGTLLHGKVHYDVQASIKSKLSS